MSELKLTSVEAVRTGLRQLDWDSSRNPGGDNPRRQRPRQRIARMLAELLPGHDPSTILVQLQQSPEGDVTAVLLVDSESGRLLLTLEPSFLEQQAMTAETTGLLVERSG